MHCQTISYLNTLSRTIPHVNTLNRTIPYLNTLNQTMPYLNTTSQTIHYLNTLCQLSRQPIRIHYYVTRELSATVEDPSRLSARLGSL